MKIGKLDDFETAIAAKPQYVFHYLLYPPRPIVTKSLKFASKFFVLKLHHTAKLSCFYRDTCLKKDSKIVIGFQLSVFSYIWSFRRIALLYPDFRGNIYAMRNDRSSNSYDIQTTILANEEVAEAHYLLRCECPEIAQHARPGQFIHVMISQGPGLLLRRPFTIYTVEGPDITMLYQIIGEGTKQLSEMPKGATIASLRTAW